MYFLMTLNLIDNIGRKSEFSYLLIESNTSVLFEENKLPLLGTFKSKMTDTTYRALKGNKCKFLWPVANSYCNHFLIALDNLSSKKNTDLNGQTFTY